MWPTPLPAATSPFEVGLVNPYELGRQPFGLAEPAALLKDAGFAVACLDRSLHELDPDVLRNARLVAIHVGMHTATRIAVEALPHIQRIAPHAHLCVYGLYALMNEALLRRLGVGTVLGGEVELALPSLGLRLRANGTAAAERGTEPAQSALIPEGWHLSDEAAQRPVPTISADLGSAIPRLSEPWYCCAEPTNRQLQSF